MGGNGAESMRWKRPGIRNCAISLAILGLMTAGAGLYAQVSSAPSTDGQQNGTDAPPEAGGPQTETGPYAIPKKKEEPPPPPPPSRPKKIEGIPDYTLHVDVPLVEVPVAVVTKDGQFISTLTQGNFRISEDGVQQKIAGFGVSQAPITAVLLVEFATGSYYFINDLLQASYAFAGSLKKDDWLSIISYDMKPTIVADFTQNKQEVYGALGELRIPLRGDSNLFDALYDTLDRIDRIEGRKYIILVTTGIDTFSKINLDQITRKIKDTKNVTIFPVSVGWQLRTMAEAQGGAAPHGSATGLGLSQLDYLQADNEMNTFAKLTGGRAYFPRFEAEYQEIFRDIVGDIRNQYNISYRPSNPKLDGTYRKLKVDVVAPDGGPLKVKDQKGKDVKVQIIAREGYTAKHTVE